MSIFVKGWLSCANLKCQIFRTVRKKSKLATQLDSSRTLQEKVNIHFTHARDFLAGNFSVLLVFICVIVVILFSTCDLIKKDSFILPYPAQVIEEDEIPDLIASGDRHPNNSSLIFLKQGYCFFSFFISESLTCYSFFDNRFISK